MMPKPRHPARAATVEKLRALMAAGEWRAAILFAAQFQRLPPEQRGAILSAREAYLRPAFQEQLGRSIDQLIAAGHAALQEAYGEKETA